MENNQQFAQTEREIPGTTITQTRPVEGGHREQLKSLSMSTERKEMAIDKLVENAVENQLHTIDTAQTQNHTIRR